MPQFCHKQPLFRAFAVARREHRGCRSDPQRPERRQIIRYPSDIIFIAPRNVTQWRRARLRSLPELAGIHIGVFVDCLVDRSDGFFMEIADKVSVQEFLNALLERFGLQPNHPFTALPQLLAQLAADGVVVAVPVSVGRSYSLRIRRVIYGAKVPHLFAIGHQHILAANGAVEQRLLFVDRLFVEALRDVPQAPRPVGEQRAHILHITPG